MIYIYLYLFFVFFRNILPVETNLLCNTDNSFQVILITFKIPLIWIIYGLHQNDKKRIQQAMIHESLGVSKLSFKAPSFFTETAALHKSKTGFNFTWRWVYWVYLPGGMVQWLALVSSECSGFLTQPKDMKITSTGYNNLATGVSVNSVNFYVNPSIYLQPASPLRSAGTGFSFSVISKLV